MNPERDTERVADRRAKVPTPVREAHGEAAGLSVLTSIRAGIAGVLMGIANLIPGVSGGTMVLAIGLYEEFIDSVAEISALRFSVRRIVFLGIVGACAACAIVGLAGSILYLLFHYTIAMFALFIGLTLGGAPLLFKSLRPVRADVVVSVVAGLALMIGVLVLKGGRGFPHNPAMDFASGVVGSTTMVLPGISGSYMLLILDQYDRIVGAVRDLKDGVKARDVQVLKGSLAVVVPVGVGVVFGIVLLSNILKILLHRFHRPTVGALLGILLGSVIGLWPFSQPVGEKALEGRTFAEIVAYARLRGVPAIDGISDKRQLIEHVCDPESQSRMKARPLTVPAAGLALAMVLVGFAGTFVLSRLGASAEADRGPRAAPEG